MLTPNNVREATIMLCPYCKNGKVQRLDNYVDAHFNACAPVYVEEDCEECGGTGGPAGMISSVTQKTTEEGMALEQTCIATQLIEQLRQLVEQHGDLPVYADDADTGWRLPIGLTHKPADADEEWPERLEIKTAYYGRPEGDLVKANV